MRKDKSKLDGVQEVIKKSQNFESTLVDIRRKSEKRAWIVAGISTFVALCLIGGLFYILPLKEKEPYLVMADAYTGQSTVAKLNGNWKANSITTSEAVNKSNISHFVVARESFDNQLIYLRDWATVYSMSIPDVSNEYRAWMNQSNAESPLNVYGSQKSIRVQILSIVLNNSGKTNTWDGATVRFQRFIFDKSSGATQYIDNKIATLAFTYNSNLQMDEKYRVENPLGFQVTSYRVDNDVNTPPPPGAISNSTQLNAAPDTAMQQQSSSPVSTLPAQPSVPVVNPNNSVEGVR